MRGRVVLVAAMVAIGVSGCASKAEHAGVEAGSGGSSAPPGSTSPASPASPASTPSGHSCPARITPTPDADGVVHGVAIDYVDLIHFHGRDFQSTDDARPKQADLGASVGRVLCTLSGPSSVDPGYQMQDGDATFVAAGSPIYLVKGVSPDRELAAVHDGAMHLYKVLLPG